MRKSKVLSFMLAATLVVPQVALVSAAGTTPTPKAYAPKADAIVITNYAIGKDDTVTVADNTYKVNLYNAETGSSIVGTITAGGTTITSSKLLNAGGEVWATYLGKTGFKESDRTKITYAAAPKSDPILIGDVAVKNNFGTSKDTLTVSSVAVGDTVALTVYTTSAAGVRKAGTPTKVTVKTGTTAEFKPKLGSVAGDVYATITKTGKTESNVLTIPYKAEAVLGVAGDTTKEDGGSLDYTVEETVYYGIPDVIIVSNKNSKLTVKDKINIYAYDKTPLGLDGKPDKTKKDLIGTGTVNVTSKTDSAPAPVKISVKDLQTSCANTWSVADQTYKYYVTVTRANYIESERKPIEFDPDPITTTSEIKTVVVNNKAVLNKDGKDTVKDLVFVYGLQPKDKITVYNAAAFVADQKNAKKDTTLVTTGTVAAGQSQVAIPVTVGTKLYITSTRPGKIESDRVELTIPANGEAGEQTLP